MNPMSPIEESKTPMCLSPQDKLKSGGNLSAQRSKRSHATGALAGANDAKKARLDDVFKTELDMDMDGWISDDYLRSMDLDDCLNQDIDWVAHDEVDLALSMDTLAQEQAVSVGGDDVNDFGFNSASFMSPLRGGLAFEDPAEMASTFVDPAYIHLEPSNNAKDAEKLLMSFDTMNFAIPSPTSASRKEKRGASFVDKESAAKRAEVKPVGVAITSAATASSLSNGDVSSSLKVQVPASSATLDQDQAPTPATGSSTPSVSTDSLLSVLNTDMTTPKSSQSSGKKIGSYSPEARKLRLQKFHEKRKNRTWKKSIKYDCRKKLADDRPRIKGRFVRVLENAGDAKAGGASPTAPVSTSPSSAPTAGYASPTSPTGAIAPPAMTLPSAVCKSTSVALQTTAAVVPRVVPSFGSKQTTGTSVSTSVAASASSAALPFARMIASV